MEETNKEKNVVDKLKKQASQVANNVMSSEILEKIKNRGNSAFQKLLKWQLNNWKNGSNQGKAKVIGLNLIVLLVLGNIFLSGASTPQQNDTSVVEAMPENKFTAFNSGTGVVPKYRGRRIVKQLYDFAIPELLKRGVEKCGLEVIKENEKAIKAYRRVGFEIIKILKCLIKSTGKSGNNENLH